MKRFYLILIPLLCSLAWGQTTVWPKTTTLPKTTVLAGGSGGGCCTVAPTFVSGHFVDGGGAGSSQTSVTLPTMANVSGDAIIVVEGFCTNSSCNSTTSGITTTAPTDTATNTYSQIFRYDTPTTGAFTALVVYCADNVATSASNAITINSSGAYYFAGSVFEITNQATTCASLLDQSGTFTSASTSSSPISISTTGSTVDTNEMVVGAINNSGYTAGSGFSLMNSSGGFGSTESMTQAATGTATATFTFTGTKTIVTAAVLTLKGNH
jgi:hypothetical protein